MADNNKTSSMGALLRGAANALTLGLDDEALTGASKLTNGYIPDYGATLRADEASDETQHPYARMAGEVAGAVAPNLIPGVGEANDARLLVRGANLARDVVSNPIANGAISAVGNSNDLNDGNISGAAEQALTGAGEGAVMGAALNAVGRKFATGTFGKTPPGQVIQTSNYTDINPSSPPVIGDWLNKNGVPTPVQNRMTSGDSGMLASTLGNYIQNATRASSNGLRTNRDLLNQVNRSFPYAAANLTNEEIDPLTHQIFLSVERANPNGYNATTLKDALDRHINGAFSDSRQYGNGVNDFGIPEGANHADDGYAIMSSPLYKMVQDAAPIHAQMEENIKAPSTNSGSMLKHAIAIGSTGLSIAGGHTPAGILTGAAVEGIPLAGRALGNAIGIDATRKVMQDPMNAMVPNISATRENIGNAIQNVSGPLAGRIAAGTNEAVSGNNVPEDAYNANAQVLKKNGFSDAEIEELLK